MDEEGDEPVEVVRRGYDALSLRYRSDDADAAEYAPWIAELLAAVAGAASSTSVAAAVSRSPASWPARVTG